MKRTVIFAITLIAIVLFSTPIFAQNINVTARVIKNCSITYPAGLAFGNYDPTLTTDTYAQATVTVKCTAGTPWRVDLSAGSNSASATAPSTRAMANAGNFLSYELYQSDPSAGPASVWGSGAGSGLEVTAPNASSNNYTIWGAIPAGQNAPAAATDYTDVVVASFNF